ncbi:MAG: metallophosphoesterase [Vicinamibacterales bacterium]
MARQCLAAAALATAVLTTASCVAFVPYDLQPLPSAPAAPDLSQRSRLVFVVVGDSGRGNEAQHAVGRLMQAVCAALSCDFAIAPGDLIYDRGVHLQRPGQAWDPQFASKFEAPFRGVTFPFWSVPGNHDWGTLGSVQAEIDYTNASETWRMPFNHFPIERLPAWIRIYGLDTVLIDEAASRPDERAEADQQLADAKAYLCDGGATPAWRLAFGHHPLYSSGQHGREANNLTNLRQRLGGLIETCRVQVYFAGHEHMQELLQVSGPTARPGLAFVQVIQGAGSEARTNDRPLPETGVTTWGVKREPGFGLVQVDRERMTVEYYGTRSSPRPDGRTPVPFLAFSLQPEGVSTLQRLERVNRPTGLH